MDFISVFAHSFFSVSAKTTCQAPAGFNLFFSWEHSTTSDLFQVSAHSGKHRFTSPFHSRMVGHAKAIWQWQLNGLSSL